MYSRSGAGPHLTTVNEEDVFNTAGDSEATTEQQDPDLPEYAAVALAASSAQSSIHNSNAEPSRILLVRNVTADVQDEELQDIFQAFGDVQGLHTACKPRGIVVVAYYDLRSAVSAQSTLQGTLMNKVAIDVQFAAALPGKDGKSNHQGQVTVFNLDPETSNEQLVWLFSKFGEVQGITQSAARPNQKFITFYDVRHAAQAMRAMNRAEQLNKIPSYVTPQQMANLQSSTSGPNLMQLAQLQGVEGTTGSGSSGSSGNIAHTSNLSANATSWNGLPASATMEGLLQIVNQQHQAGHANQHHHAGGVTAMLQAGVQDATGAYGRLGMDQLNANARGLPLSDSASSIAGVPANLLSMAAGNPTAKSLSGHQITGLQTKVSGSTGMASTHQSLGVNADNKQHAGASMYDRHAAQQLNLLQASEAANMLMGLNLGGNQASHNSMLGAGWPGDNKALNQLSGMQDGGAGLWSGANNLLGGNTAGFNQLAALQELQLRQQQHLALQAANGGLGQLNAAANLQAAAQILQAAGLNQFGGNTSYLGQNAYHANAAAQILQQAGLGLPGLNNYHIGGYQNMLGHGAGGRGGGVGPDASTGARSGGRLSRRTTDPTAEAERKAQQEKLYALDLEKIGRGEDRRTTLMIKNIPNKYTQKMLLATIDEHFRGTYDFFYLPIDFKNKCNVGYAFINMTQPYHIIPLVQRFNMKKWERFNSEKVCNISYARIQGRVALVQHFQNSSLMHEDKRCRPILFTVDDHTGEAGDQEPFPAPNLTPSSSHGHGLSGSGGSTSKLSGLAGSSNSLARSNEGSTNSLRDLAHRHSHHASIHTMLA